MDGEIAHRTWVESLLSVFNLYCKIKWLLSYVAVNRAVTLMDLIFTFGGRGQRGLSRQRTRWCMEED